MFCKINVANISYPELVQNWTTRLSFGFVKRYLQISNIVYNFFLTRLLLIDLDFMDNLRFKYENHKVPTDWHLSTYLLVNYPNP